MGHLSILVVEDEAVTQYFIKYLLEAHGHSVSVAMTGEEAVQLALEHNPDFILMDIGLAGDMDGIEAAKKIRSCRNIPVVFLTAYTEDSIVSRAAEASPYGYLTKPFKEKDLYNTIKIGLTHHEMQKKLAWSEKKFRTLFNDVPVAILMITAEGQLLDINAAGVDLFGYPDKPTMLREFKVGNHFQDAAHREAFRNSMLSEKRVKDVPTVLRRLNGEDRNIVGSASAELDEHGAVVAYRGILHDVTELVQRERKLEALHQEAAEMNRKLRESQGMVLQQEKLASIGQLAAGVAHELNNPIGFISSNLTTLRNYFSTLTTYITLLEDAAGAEDGSPRRQSAGAEATAFRARKKVAFILSDVEDLLKESSEGTERVTTIVRNLRNFSRVDFDEQRAPYDLREGVESTLVVARNEVKYVADTVTELGEVPPVMCLAGEINQVLLNLIVNAAHAIRDQNRQDRGKITISTWEENGSVFCRVADDGPGIKPEHLEKVFDPFFTTKEVGKGTGLGLSISYNIVVGKHGGTLAVHSRPGEGAAFTISLPAIQD